jgi:SPX domain protein involved in polyphosphate accumulation
MNDLRIEKKIVLGVHKSDFLKKKLLENGFTRHFQDREISSLYIDTIDYNNAKDNINGISRRKKIRLRWYNNDTSEIFIEEKNKNNFTVWKNIESFNFKLNKQNLLKKFSCLSTLKNNNFLKNNNYKFILRTNYKRSYWLSSNNKIRATIDNNLKTASFFSNNFINLPDTILEFKFSPEDENNFRDLFRENFYDLRINKYSKYVRSFIALEECGYQL